MHAEFRKWYFRTLGGFWTAGLSILVFPFLTKLAEDKGWFGSATERVAGFRQAVSDVLHNALVGWIGGGTLGILTAFAIVLVVVAARQRGYFEPDGFTSPDHLAQRLGLPVLGAVPSIEKGTSLSDAMSYVRSGFSEANNAIRTRLKVANNIADPEYRTDRHDFPKRIMISSARPGEGKSTISCALAQGFARIGFKTLVIDADLRNPSIHRLLSVDSSTGISNILVQRSDQLEFTKSVIRETQEVNLFVIPCGPLPPNPVELLSSMSRGYWEKLSELFDIIIIDSPPVLGLADVIEISSSVCASILFIVEANRTTPHAVSDAISRIRTKENQPVYTILNKCSNKFREGYSYGYGYGYDYAYEYGSRSNSP